jgi:hypothetical protein
MQIIDVLKSHGVNDVGEIILMIMNALKSELSVNGVAQNSIAIAKAIIAKFSISTYDLIKKIAEALYSVYTYNASEILTILMQVLNSISETLTNTELAEILKSLGFLANEIATALKNILGLGAQTVAEILDGLGYLLSTVATILKDVFSKSKEAAADILVLLGKSATSIASAIKTAYSLTATGVAEVLKHIGTSLTEAIDIVFGLFTLAWDTVVSIVTAVFSP